jgi:RimJ/RimL family protein N-acetyltransferase
MEPLPARLEHDGLVLRRWTVDDAELVGELVAANLEHLRPYMPWIEHEPLTLDARRELEREWDRAWADGGDVIMGIFEHDVAVGSAGLHRRIGPGGLEIGYWVSADHLGKGIARRASEGLTSLAFTVPGIDRVEIHHDLTNVYSRRVPEQLGFHLVGKAKVPRAPQAPADTGVDLVWRITRDEWLTARPA